MLQSPTMGYRIQNMCQNHPGVDGGPPSRGIIDLIANLGGIHITSCLRRLDLREAMQVIE